MNGAREVLIELASRLVTIDERHPIWSDRKADLGCDGSLVRIRAPLDATDEYVQFVRDKASEMASAVRVLPRAKAEVLVRSEPEAAVVQTIRDVVMELADNANTSDRIALKSLLDTVLASNQL